MIEQQITMPSARLNFLKIAPAREPVQETELFPNRKQFFEKMAIDVPAGQQSRFVIGDNVKGYFEGFTSSYRRGAGYILGQRAFFKGFGAAVDNKLLNRTGVEANQRLFPFGFSSHYPQGEETLVFHPGQQSLSLRVQAAKPSVLHVVVFLELDLSSVKPIVFDDALVFGPTADDAPGEDPSYLAITLDRDGFISSRFEDVPEALAVDLSISPKSGFVVAGGVQVQEEITVTLAFGNTAEEARQRALKWADRDAVGVTANQWYQYLTKSRMMTDDAEFNRALLWAEASSRSFYVEVFGKGLWAGLPWFRDYWGRDTFIALPGTFFVTGHFNDSRLVIENFLQYQNKGGGEGRFNTAKDVGRIPNRVNKNEIIYNTVDGTPLMLKAIREYIAYTGDIDFGKKVLPAVRLYLESSLQHWVDQNGLLTHDDADTWMDARISGRQPWSARGNRAIEIQALWYQALKTASDLEAWAGNAQESRRWLTLAEKVKTSVERLFWNGQELADRLRPDGSADRKPRPNAFIALANHLEPDWLKPEIQTGVIQTLVPQLVYPYGVSSLGINHPYFHPRHENPGFYHKDAAYHNGALWGWLAGPVITVLARWGRQDFAYQLTQNLTEQILYQGALGTLSENVNAEPGPDRRPVLTGTFSQSWSVAEFARNAYQDYLGVIPDLVLGRIVFAPRMPQKWTEVTARLSIGLGNLVLLWQRKTNDEFFRLETRNLPTLKLLFLPVDQGGRRLGVELNLSPNTPLEFTWNGSVLRQANRTLPTTVLFQAPNLGELTFVKPPTNWNDFPVLKESSVLQKIILNGEFH